MGDYYVKWKDSSSNFFLYIFNKLCCKTKICNIAFYWKAFYTTCLNFTNNTGVIGLTKSAARELAQRGVTCNAIAPGFIETDMTDVLGEDVKEAMLGGVTAPIPVITHLLDI